MIPCLSDAAEDKESLVKLETLSPEKKLRSVRSQFVDGVSEAVLKQLLDQLLQRQVINEEENESANTKCKADKARAVIDMVRRKGSEASSFFITHFCKLDPQLSKTLKLS